MAVNLEGNFLILKVCFVCALLVIAFLFWFIAKMYKGMFLFTSDVSNKCNDLKKLLFDLRDGTKTFYEEKRKSQRIKDGLTIKIVTGGFNEFVKVLDVSREGALFRTTKKPRRDEIIDLNMYLPLFPQPISVKAKIVRVSLSSEEATASDVGVKYLHIADHDKEKLTETLKMFAET